MKTHFRIKVDRAVKEKKKKLSAGLDDPPQPQQQQALELCPAGGWGLQQQPWLLCVAAFCPSRAQLHPWVLSAGGPCAADLWAHQEQSEQQLL